ncbi:Reticulocyte-binding protein 2 a [Amphibalanus amphitrite]|uniref:Reticulocyte-binding protein 2 a n=1 Tax=Amphibalanus amphitrite TaxID=1232801 RepID=A0A6A4WIU2_AMPAM|nr:Reticulocyte-binding protein 2 a [Amphibalanus amphitrite]
MAEGVGDGRVDSGGTSDFDIMLEFDGPFRWTTTAEKPADIEPQSAPQLWARPTSKTGFVTLHWVQTTQCSHEEPLEALSATSMRKFMLELCQALEDGNINPTGPAVNITREADVTDGGIDFVFCFYVRGWWPSPDWSDGSYAVHQGITFRQEAPCWNAWWKYVIPRLVRGAPHLLPSWHYMKSATYRQQCHLFMAWSVIDPEDLAREVGETSPNVDLFTLDVTTLTRLLIPTDIHNLVIAPTPVAEWCVWQLQQPPAERPAGLTAELDTPRGRAELLLRPELLLRAIREAIPGAMIMWKVIDDMMEKNWTQNYLPQPSYEWLRETLAQHLSCDLQYNLRVRVQPEMDGATVVATAGLWRRRLQQLLSGDQLRKAYDAAVSRWPDRWQLVPRYLTKDKTGKQDSSGLAQDGEIEKGEQRNEEEEEEEQPSEGLPHPKKWQLLETKHRRQWQDLEQQRPQLLQELERSDHGEKRSLLRRHNKELRCLGLRHDGECQSLQKIHRDERVELHRGNEEDGQRRWEELDRQQQLQWEGLLQGQKLQWGEMKQSHERESQELEERYPDLRSGEELDRLLEECSRRRQQLGERLQGELEREVKKEIERTQKEMLEKKKKLKKKEKRKQKKQAKKQMENDVKEMKKQQNRKRRRAKRKQGPTKGGTDEV